jgi:hypothetical protein
MSIELEILRLLVYLDTVPLSTYVPPEPREIQRLMSRGINALELKSDTPSPDSAAQLAVSTTTTPPQTEHLKL